MACSVQPVRICTCGLQNLPPLSWSPCNLLPLIRSHMRPFRYLQGTIGYGLRYAANVDLSLEGYAEADWAGSAVDRKSTSGSCFTLGSTMVSWCSRKQSSVALSTTEAKHIALSVAVREAVWLRKLLTDLSDHEMDPTTIHCDNQSCVKLSKNLVFHDKSKHIEIKYHYIRDMVQRKTIHV
jgi:hypothetical protein